MKHRVESEHAGYSWPRPPQQGATVEVLHSNERPSLPSVFGTSSPPAGLSGSLRRLAFRSSESSYGHWLPLMLADRVNEAEGVLDDLGRGRVPDLFAERGMKAEWNRDRAALIERFVVGAVVTSAVAGRLVGLARRRP